MPEPLKGKSLLNQELLVLKLIGLDPKNTRKQIWHWTHGPQAGRKLYFNAQGKLEQVTAASGATLSLQRGPAGELLKVTDPQGRTLSFKYASKDQIARAQARPASPASPARAAFFADRRAHG